MSAVAREWFCGGGIGFRSVKFGDESFVVVDEFKAAGDRTFWALVREQAMREFTVSLRVGESTLGFAITWVEVRQTRFLPVGPKEMKALDGEVLRRGIQSLEHASGIAGKK